MTPKFPKFIQDELERTITRQEAYENLKSIKHLFEESRIDNTINVVKLLFLNYAKQEIKIQSIIEENEKLKHQIVVLLNERIERTDIKRSDE